MSFEFQLARFADHPHIVELNNAFADFYSVYLYRIQTVVVVVVHVLVVMVLHRTTVKLCACTRVYPGNSADFTVALTSSSLLLTASTPEINYIT